jgi:glycogen(starch) synthase
MGGALRRFQKPRYTAYRRFQSSFATFHSLERELARTCDLVVSPSQALADWALREWAIPAARTMVVPYPYTPSERLLRIPAGGTGKVVGYFGRLEERKGVADLIDAIPLILRAEPDARFRFVGRPLAYPGTAERYDLYLLRRLHRYRSAIEIVGPCPLDQMPEQYAAVDVCIFPSVWENFPNVCLEAMAAGRAIVASRAGGMAEMLEGGKHGILIPPRNAKAIAEGVVRMLRSSVLRQTMGAGARQRVLDAYSVEKIGPQLEQTYTTAISLSREKGLGRKN